MDYKTAYEIQKRAYERLLKLALRAVVGGPGSRGAYTTTAGIPWPVLEEMMDELDSLGIKWRELRTDRGKRLPRKDALVPTALDGEGETSIYDEEPDPSLGAGASVEAYRG